MFHLFYKKNEENVPKKTILVKHIINDWFLYKEIKIHPHVLWC